MLPRMMTAAAMVAGVLWLRIELKHRRLRIAHALTEPQRLIRSQEDDWVTYCYSGRDFRVTDIDGCVVHDILA
jgi:hypothetical protein